MTSVYTSRLDDETGSAQNKIDAMTLMIEVKYLGQEAATALFISRPGHPESSGPPQDDGMLNGMLDEKLSAATSPQALGTLASTSSCRWSSLTGFLQALS